MLFFIIYKEYMRLLHVDGKIIMTELNNGYRTKK